jgi:putative spermidine/putrescine transport system permease protein
MAVEKTTPTPLSWRALDLLEESVAWVWPSSRSSWTPYLFLLPAVLVVGILMAGLVVLADASLRIVDRETFYAGEDYSLGNYREIFSRPFFMAILGRSLWGAALVTIFTLILAFPYAYLMVRTPHSLLRKFLLFSLFLPFFIGQVVRAYGWLIVLGQDGMVNNVLVSLGLSPIRLLYNFPAVVAGLTQYMLPFAVLLISPAIVGIDEELENASAGLGASWPLTWWHVVFPLAAPGIIGASVVVFTISLTDFAMPAIMGGGKSDFMANLIYAAFFNITDSGLGSALSIILVLLGSTLFAIFYVLVGRRTMARRVT